AGARQLAAQAFTLAARQAARGTDPGGPLRHQLLLLTVEVAASWAADGRAGGLDAGLHLVLSSSGPEGPAAPPMLAAFRSLPYRTQGLIWYGVVEREPADRTAAFLGLTREDVTYGIDGALQALGQACLRSRLGASDDPRCGDFRRLIEESVRPDGPRDSADLRAHMAHCACCTAAHEELCALRDDPRTTLAEGLLPWAGTAYGGDVPVAAGADSGSLGAGVTTGVVGGVVAGGVVRARSRRLVLVSAALGVAAVPLLLLVLSPGEAPSERTGGSNVPSPAPPPVTVTATASPSLTASPSRTPASPSPTPSPSRTASHSARPTPAPTRTAPAYPPPGDSYAPVVNLATGLCLDIDGDFENRTDVVTARCDGSSSQRWRFDAGRGVLQSAADDDFCLDSRGAVDRGVGIWSCSSVEGRNGQNLRFTVDSRGVIRPAIAPSHAVTPGGGDSVGLVSAAERTDQRWRAGG
ncbi:RICIN domain-containing protein, partial [Streptomyces sp. 15-116A]|uniref:RICIN domain-containing protein n=1 Tax=Streptomyces sp. 15-116A TaxID=2259035 RepID=UPI0021B40299